MRERCKGLGALWVFGSLGYFLWGTYEAWNGLAWASSIAASSGQVADWFGQTVVRQFELLFWLVVNVFGGGLLVKYGERREASETDSANLELLEEGDHSWRKSPFQRGEVSEIVLPRGEFHKNRNKFRKTIERPNSEGY
jgi:hypothetical protein